MPEQLPLQSGGSHARPRVGRIGRAGLALAAGLLCALLVVILYAGGSGQLQAAPTDPPKPISPLAVPPTEVGIGIGGIAYYTSDDPFADVVKTHGQLSFAEPWGDIPAAMLDATGHAVHIPRGKTVAVVLRWNSYNMIDAADCTISPGWQKRILGHATISGGDQQFRVSFTRKEPATWLMLTPSAASADLTTLSCRAVNASRDATFMPVFLDDIRPFRVLRFMDWTSTNGSPLRVWAERRTPANFNQIGDVAVEHLVDLANTAKADPWFNMPMDASPDYYRQYAIYVRDHLAPDRKVYVELSNEVWNTSFKQGRDAVERGKAAYPGIPDAKAGDFYYADRVKATMAIWSEVFAGKAGRLVRVASSQAAWAERANDILSHNQTWRSVDMVATAPYFGTDGYDVTTDDPKVRIDTLFARGPKVVDDQIKAALAVKAIAAKYGVRYGTYEGGPGYYSGAPPMQAQLNDMARDPRMYDLYTLFMERWRKEVGGLYMAYYSTGEFAQSGAWGHKEYAGQPLSEAPKMRALASFIDRNGLNR